MYHDDAKETFSNPFRAWREVEKSFESYLVLATLIQKTVSKKTKSRYEQMQQHQNEKQLGLKDFFSLFFVFIMTKRRSAKKQSKQQKKKNKNYFNLAWWIEKRVAMKIKEKGKKITTFAQ